MGKKKLSLSNITREQSKLINDNIKVIFDVVKKSEFFNSCSKDELSELHSQGYIELCKRVKNFKEDDNFYSFAYNILRYSLYNYYIRNMKGYKTIYTADTIFTDEELSEKEVYDNVYDEQLKEWEEEIKIWKIFKKEWCVQYNTPFLMKKPEKPTKKYYSKQKRLCYISFDEESMGNPSYTFDFVQEDQKNAIKNVVMKMNPIKRFYAQQVFYNGIAPKNACNSINTFLINIKDKVKDKIEMSDYLKIPRKDVLNKRGNDDIENFFYDRIVRYKEQTVDEIYNNLKAKSHHYFTKQIIKEIKSRIEN